MKKAHRPQADRKARKQRLKRMQKEGRPLGRSDLRLARQMNRPIGLKAKSERAPGPSGRKDDLPPQTYRIMDVDTRPTHRDEDDEDTTPATLAEVPSAGDPGRPARNLAREAEEAHLASERGWKRDKNGKWREKGKFVSKERLAAAGLSNG